MKKSYDVLPASSVWILIGVLSLTSLVMASAASAASAQGQVVSVGILSFQDESGTNAPPEFCQKIAKDLRQRLVAFSDLLPRVTGSGGNALEVQAMSVEQLTALGKQQGVKHILRGGLLAITAVKAGDEAKITVQLYAEIVSVESGGVSSVRAEGVGTQQGTPSDTGINWNSYNFADSQFPNSALGQALSTAIEQLAAAIHPAITSPASNEQSQPPSEAIQTQNVAAADSDEELQQLIAQAEALMANASAGSAENLPALGQTLEKLKAALASKATLMEQAQDTAQADQEIAARKQELQVVVSTLMQQVASADTAVSEVAQPSGEKQSLLAAIGGYLGETASILQKIQELRAALRAEGGAPDSGEIPAPTPAEEPTEEVSGVVTEGGEPVEGATVTDPESDASATTDSNGFYALKVVAAGRLANLIVNKDGKKMAAGQIDLLRGRSAVADFEIKPKSMGASVPALRIIPSTVVVRAHQKGGSMGLLNGVVRDAQGKPVARALVNLKGLGVARTDSLGRYTFLNVPAGAHQLTVHRSGLRLKSERVQVMARGSSESKTQFASNDTIARDGNRQSLILRGSGTVLRGVVLDTERRPLAGAKITLIQSSSATSVLTGVKGGYELRDVKPGTHKLMASKTGYAGGTQLVALRVGGTELRDFQLKKTRPLFVERALATQRSTGGSIRIQSRVPVTQTVRPELGQTQPSGRVSEQRPVVNSISRLPSPVALRSGQVRGQVRDAKTGKPIAGALILIAGQRSVMTDQAGSYAVANLAPGAYQVTVRKNDFTDSGATFTIRPGETVARNFQLNGKSAPRIRLRTPGRQ